VEEVNKLPVSIVIPVYCYTSEQVGWLEECLASACSQNCSVVVCDDNSPLLEDVKRIVTGFPFDIFIDSTNNNGVSYARNAAIENCDTDYILPLDSDDRLVSGAVEQLYDFHRQHNDTPTYPDVSKFGDEVVSHYELLDFDCENITKFVGFSSVNVLHRTDQWKSIGGYDASVRFYEDGEYNARLFASFCGVRYPHPLVEYRIHQYQRTKQYDSQSRAFALTLLERIRRMEMACPGCSKRRTQSLSQNALSKMAVQSAPVERVTVNIGEAPTHLPIQSPDGKVLSVYIGGQGRAKHYYQGIVSKQPYKVSYGDYLYVDERDSRSKDNIGSRSLLVRVEKSVEKTPQPITEVVVSSKPKPVVDEVGSIPQSVIEEVVRIARTSVEKTPVDRKKRK